MTRHAALGSCLVRRRRGAGYGGPLYGTFLAGGAGGLRIAANSTAGIRTGSCTRGVGNRLSGCGSQGIDSRQRRLGAPSPRRRSPRDIIERVGLRLVHAGACEGPAALRGLVAVIAVRLLIRDGRGRALAPLPIPSASATTTPTPAAAAFALATLAAFLARPVVAALLTLPVDAVVVGVIAVGLGDVDMASLVAVILQCRCGPLADGLGGEFILVTLAALAAILANIGAGAHRIALETVAAPAATPPTAPPAAATILRSATIVAIGVRAVIPALASALRPRGLARTAPVLDTLVEIDVRADVGFGSGVVIAVKAPVHVDRVAIGSAQSRRGGCGTLLDRVVGALQLV